MTVRLMTIPALVGLALGFRHGLDWDHLTAIGDLVGSPGQRSKRSLALAAWYGVGHGLVIALLGIAVGLLGVRLPYGLDRIFEVVVGVTLVLLGLLVLRQVWHERSRYQYGSRWILLIDLLRRAWFRRKGREEWDKVSANLSGRAAFSIGVLHGTGAETPTQVVLFASAAASGSSTAAAVILGAFIVGLLASDVLVAAAWLSGRLARRRLPRLQLSLGLITGVSSVSVGLLFVAGRANVLPALFGG
jgi:high-affinity nickel-transport protein